MSDQLLQQYREEIESLKGEIALLQSRDHCLTHFFDFTPIAIWINDLSKIKQEIDHIEQESSLEQFLGNNREGFLSLLLKINVIDMNPEALKLHGATSKEEVLTRLSEIFIPEIFAVLKSGLLAIRDRKNFFAGEGVIGTLGGMRQYVRVSWRMLPGDEDDFSQVILSIVDMTELRSLHTALEESEIRYRNLFSNSGSVMLILDPASGKIVDANRAACNYYGYQHEELTSMRIDQINRLSFEEIKYQMNFARERIQQYFVMEHQLASGELRHVEIYSGPVLFSGQNYLYSIIHDITDRIDLEEKMSQIRQRLSDREKLATIGSLAQGIAHELRNPLGIISNSLYFLEMSRGEDIEEKQQKHLNIMHREIQRSTKIISDLMSYASLERLRFDDGDLMPVLQRICRGKRSRIKIELISTLSEIPLRMDQRKLEMALRKVVDNAFEAVDQNGSISIEVALCHNYYQINIRDDGEGIPREFIPSIFKPMVTGWRRGIGLGLAIVDAIIQGHLGYIEVESEYGSGSCFSLYLPTQKHFNRLSIQYEETI